MTNIFFYKVDVLSRDDFTDEDLEEDKYIWKSEEYRAVHKMALCNLFTLAYSAYMDDNIFYCRYGPKSEV